MTFPHDLPLALVTKSCNLIVLLLCPRLLHWLLEYPKWQKDCKGEKQMFCQFPAKIHRRQCLPSISACSALEREKMLFSYSSVQFWIFNMNEN